MTNKLLAVIAFNLTVLTGLMVLQNVPTAQAQSNGVQRIAICEKNTSRCVGISSNGFLR